jgi:hypothetical protein
MIVITGGILHEFTIGRCLRRAQLFIVLTRKEAEFATAEFGNW